VEPTAVRLEGGAGQVGPRARLEGFIRECLAMGDDKTAFAAKGLDDGEPYGLSKACANSYTMILACTHPSLRVNACTPGFIATDMTRPYAVSAGKTPEA
jgi:NAD(P)-dependent dehydrogenase (short-subunit alcohol dehydrogenase family)